MAELVQRRVCPSAWACKLPRNETFFVSRDSSATKPAGVVPAPSPHPEPRMSGDPSWYIDDSWLHPRVEVAPSKPVPPESVGLPRSTTIDCSPLESDSV